MLRFLFGVTLGALGYWAYSQGWLPFGSKDLFEQMSGPSAASSSPIIHPTPHEISSRPAEPIPS